MKFEKIKINKLIFPDYNPRKKLTSEDEEYKKIKFKSGKSDDVFLIDKDNKKIPWSKLVGGN